MSEGIDIEALKKNLKEYWHPLDINVDQVVSAIEQLQKENEALKEDATLFRWMHAQKCCPFKSNDVAWTELRTAIKREIQYEMEFGK